MSVFIEAPFDAGIHIKTLAPSSENGERLNELRDLLNNTGSDLYHKNRSWCCDEQLNRFLVARHYNVRQSFDLLLTALKWRDHRNPNMIEKRDGWADKIGKESETGKIYCSGSDRWDRPVVIFDPNAQNTHNKEDHMIFLAWNLEYAIREMPAHVDKYVIFMNLQHFSLFNNPSFSETYETIHMLCDCFPERLGHCICYQPPGIFIPVFNAVKRFIDPKTASKVMFVYGDIAEGSANDKEMRKILGDNWKVLTGAEQPVYKKKTSPGYRHELHWPAVLEKVHTYQAKELAAAGTDGSALVDGEVAKPVIASLVDTDSSKDTETATSTTEKPKSA